MTTGYYCSICPFYGGGKKKDDKKLKAFYDWATTGIPVKMNQNKNDNTLFAVHYQKNILSFMLKVISIAKISFSLTLEYISLVLIELSIRIFEYVSIFNNVN